MNADTPEFTFQPLYEDGQPPRTVLAKHPIYRWRCPACGRHADCKTNSALLDGLRRHQAKCPKAVAKRHRDSESIGTPGYFYRVERFANADHGDALRTLQNRLERDDELRSRRHRRGQG